MSFIWNVVLSFSDEEYWEDGEDEARQTSAALDAVNAWIPDGELVDLTPPTYAPGAGAGMSAHLYGGGFKHFDLDGFLAVVAAQPWKDPDTVQVFLQSDADARFEVRCLRRVSQSD
jgi:hypothetical protein